MHPFDDDEEAAPSPNVTAQREDEAALLGGNAGSFMFPSPGNGFTKSRNAQYAAALTLDLAMAGQQVDAALKFATMAEPVRDVLPEFSGLRKIAAHPRRESPGELVEFYPRGAGVGMVDTRRVTFRCACGARRGRVNMDGGRDKAEWICADGRIELGRS